MKAWRLITLSIVLIAGMMLPSASVRAAPTTVDRPAAPTITKVVPGYQSATVTWESAVFVQIYRAEVQINVYRNGQLAYPSHVAVAAGASSGTVTGLTNNVPYTFTVQMRLLTLDNPPQVSLWSESQPSGPVVPGIVPSMPIKVDAHAAQGYALITWGAPTVGTSPVSSYRLNVYQRDEAGLFRQLTSPQVSYTMGPTGTIAEVRGLDTGGTYQFAVQARNLTGWSAESTPRSAPLTPSGYGPASPTIASATPGDGSVTLHWTTPYAYNLDHYLVLVYGENVGLVAYRDGVVSSPLTISGLTNGVAYGVQLATIDSAHMMSAPTMVRVVPQPAMPPVPTSLQVRLNDRGAALYWNAPTPDPAVPIDHYTVQVTINGTLVWGNEYARETSVGVTGLIPGRVYVAEVRSVSTAGVKSNPVTATFTAATLPGSPVNVTAVVMGSQVVISWMPPTYDGSSALTGYIVTSTTGMAKESSQVTVSPGQTSTPITGLALGRTYTFTVSAMNAVGTGLQSAPSAPVTLATVPSMVRNLTVTDADEAATVKWDLPLSDGFSPITGYQVTASDGVHAPVAVTVTGTSVVLSPLTNGVAYTVSVVPFNTIGRGQAATATVTPRNAPPALTVPGAQTVQYSDALSLTVSATDRDSRDHIVLTATELPEGLTFTQTGNGTGTVSGTIQSPAGTYTVSFVANDGHNAAVTGTTTITVTREAATLVPAGTSGSLTVKTPNDKARAVTVKVRLTEASDGAAGLISRAMPVTITLRPMGSGTTYSRVVDTRTISGSTLVVSTTFRNLPTNVYRVTFAVGGNYYSGEANSLFTVSSPTVKGSITAKGAVVSQRAPGIFSVYARFGTNGKPKGTFVYGGRHTEGNFTLSGKIVGLVIRNHRAFFQGEGTMNGVSGFRFTVALTDNRNLGMPGQVSLWTVDPQHAVVGHCSFAISEVANGTVKVSAT